MDFYLLKTGLDEEFCKVTFDVYIDTVVAMKTPSKVLIFLGLLLRNQYKPKFLLEVIDRTA